MPYGIKALLSIETTYINCGVLQGTICEYVIKHTACHLSASSATEPELVVMCFITGHQ